MVHAGLCSPALRLWLSGVFQFMKFAYSLLAVAVLLVGYGTLAYLKRGEVLHTQPGVVTQCVRLGGADSSRFHATIKAASGSYLIAELADCRADREVSVLTRRGALYFNTVFNAE